MNRIDIQDKTLRIYGGENQDMLMNAIVLKEIKGFKIDEVQTYLTTLTLFTQWGETTITVKHEEANCLINRLSDVLEDNRVQIPELTGNTIIVKVNRHLSASEHNSIKEEMELALNKKVIILDKSMDIIGSIENGETEDELEDNVEEVIGE